MKPSRGPKVPPRPVRRRTEPSRGRRRRRARRRPRPARAGTRRRSPAPRAGRAPVRKRYPPSGRARLADLVREGVEDLHRARDIPMLISVGTARGCRRSPSMSSRSRQGLLLGGGRSPSFRAARAGNATLHPMTPAPMIAISARSAISGPPSPLAVLSILTQADPDASRP